jgi:hypothetical protein
MFSSKITFARVRMLVLTCLMLLAIFGQVGGERTAKCFNCERAVCPQGPGPCFPGPFGTICRCYRYDGALAICQDVGNREK